MKVSIQTEKYADDQILFNNKRVCSVGGIESIEVTQTDNGNDYLQGVTNRGKTFVIDGGLAMGGTARDWFLLVDGDYAKTIHCSSAVEAIKYINTNGIV